MVDGALTRTLIYWNGLHRKCVNRHAYTDTFTGTSLNDSNENVNTIGVVVSSRALFGNARIAHEGQGASVRLECDGQYKSHIFG